MQFSFVQGLSLKRTEKKKKNGVGQGHGNRALPAYFGEAVTPTKKRSKAGRADLLQWVGGTECPLDNATPGNLLLLRAADSRRSNSPASAQNGKVFAALIPSALLAPPLPFRPAALRSWLTKAVYALSAGSPGLLQMPLWSSAFPRSQTVNWSAAPPNASAFAVAV